MSDTTTYRAMSQEQEDDWWAETARLEERTMTDRPTSMTEIYEAWRTAVDRIERAEEIAEEERTMTEDEKCGTASIVLAAAAAVVVLAIVAVCALFALVGDYLTGRVRGRKS